MKPPPRILVEWLDSSTLRGLEDPDTGGPETILSCGWLVRSDRESVVLSTSRGEGGKWVDQLTIPRRAILRMRRA